MYTIWNKIYMIIIQIVNRWDFLDEIAKKYCWKSNRMTKLRLCTHFSKI